MAAAKYALYYSLSADPRPSLEQFIDPALGPLGFVPTVHAKKPSGAPPPPGDPDKIAAERKPADLVVVDVTELDSFMLVMLAGLHSSGQRVVHVVQAGQRSEPDLAPIELSGSAAIEEIQALAGELLQRKQKPRISKEYKQVLVLLAKSEGLPAMPVRTLADTFAVTKAIGDSMMAKRNKPPSD